MKITLNVENIEVDDEIIVAALKQDYIRTKKTLDELMLTESQRELLSYEVEDFDGNTELLDALTKILKYYTTSEEFHEFVNGVNNGHKC